MVVRRAVLSEVLAVMLLEKIVETGAGKRRFMLLKVLPKDGQSGQFLLRLTGHEHPEQEEKKEEI